MIYQKIVNCFRWSFCCRLDLDFCRDFLTTYLIVEVFSSFEVHSVSEINHDVVEDCRLNVFGHLKVEINQFINKIIF